jgi:hydrogenase-4 membrane subunit HyfE
MDLTTLIIVGVVVIVILGFLVNYLLEPDIRKSATNIVFFAFAALLIFSSLRMLYTGEMRSFNVQEGEVKILMGTHPFQFWGSLVFKLSLGGFMLYGLFLKIKKR